MKKRIGFSIWSEKGASELLPWHINRTLGENEARQVEAWLESSLEARIGYHKLKKIAQSVGEQPVGHLNPGVWQLLLQKARRPAPLMSFWLSGMNFWIIAAAIALAVMLSLWAALKPGIVLNWSVSGDIPETFRVYRSRPGAASYELIQEIASQPGVTNYRFIDLRLAPLNTFVYRVEGRVSGGGIALSQSVLAPPLPAFFAQLALFLTGLLVSLTLMTILELLPGVLRMRFWLSV